MPEWNGYSEYTQDSFMENHPYNVSQLKNEPAQGKEESMCVQNCGVFLLLMTEPWFARNI